MSGTTYWPSMNGQAIFTVNLAEGLAARGHQVTVAYPSDRREPYQTLRNGVRLEHLRSFQLLPSIHPDAWVAQPRERDLGRMMEAVRPDVLHIQDHYPPSGAMLRQARRHGVRIVGTNHFMPENIAPYAPVLRAIKPVFRWIAWSWVLNIYNHAQVVTAQSKAAAALIRAAGLRPPVYPVSCGIDLKRFHPDPTIDRVSCLRRHGLDPAKTIFLFVGRVDAEKRVDVLLRAMKELRRDNVQLAVAGQGAAVRDLQALAKDLRLGDHVRFTGFIPNEELHVLLNSVAVFTMPSEAELLSIASLEAMACGRPLLLANAVALPELVAPDVNGYLFEPGDPVDAARCMELLVDHPERWAEMGRASVERARPHSLERTISRYEELYELRS
jgi:1,2-diacylglycerol 3-alpha-glucosyltransferase